jgi:hypothetical protein
MKPSKVWSQGISSNQEATRKRVKKERKMGLGAQTMLMAKQKEKKMKQTKQTKQIKHNQKSKTTTNLSTMVATYLAMGGSR